MATQIADPKTPASKPHGTTTDQVKEMESEGQAQTQGRPVETEADTDRSATDDPTGQSKGSNVEVPGSHRGAAHH